MLVAEIPTVWLQRVEREEMTALHIVKLMVEREGPGTDATKKVYTSLWDEAVSYALGVRKDARRACVYGEYALVLLAQNKGIEAFHVAKQAFDSERELAGQVCYWHRLLYMLATMLVRSGYDDQYPFLRSYTQAPPRTPRQRRERRGGRRA